MARRRGSDVAGAAVRAKERAPSKKRIDVVVSAAPRAKERAPEASAGGVTTAVVLERDQLAVLQAVAYARKRRKGGRPSVSSIIRYLVDTHMKELTKEAGPYLD